MPSYFKSADYEIYPKAGHVILNGETQKIRPKTFQLLMLLIEAEGEIVDKQQILDQVWDDVVVDDQVIFQSIKELRKVFANTEVIKTHPRKGYQWIASVEHLESRPTTESPTIDSMTSTSTDYKRIIPWAMAALLTLILGVFSFTGNEDSHTTKGSVIVLPVVSELTDIDHKWIRYGAMDQLIQRLNSSDDYGVLQTDDVLDIMKRASIPVTNATRDDINRIFKVSGAYLIVEASVLGKPGEYQLVYNLHSQTGVDKGVLLADNVALSIDELAALVGQKVGHPVELSSLQYQSSFANEMLATALELLQTNDHASAATFLQAAIQTEPDNITAKRLLAQAYVQQSEIEQAQDIIKQGLAQAVEQNNIREQARLRFYGGVSLLQDKQLDEGLELLLQAKENAVNIKDWLYLGYISAIMGKVYQAKNDYDKAKEYYLSSMEYHQVIQCPYGHAQGLLDLAQLSMIQGQYDTALERTNMSLAIIDERQLPFLKEMAMDALGKIKQQQGD